MPITRPARRRARIIAGAAAGLLLAVAVPLAASAHVEVGPDTAPAGGTTRLTFQFHHGCDDSPTTALVITVPQGVGNVMPVVEGGWSIQRQLGSNGVPTQVTFTAAAPVETGLSAQVQMDVLFDSADVGKRIAFPVLQQCVTGSTEWTQIPKAGQSDDSVDTPAPAVTVGAKGIGDEDDDDAAPSATASPSPSGRADAAGADAGADPVARWLGAGGLAAGIAALVVVLVRGRRRAG
jgi:periplasmic copper chaperone A